MGAKVGSKLQQQHIPQQMPPASGQEQGNTVTVKQGDTLWAIAGRTLGDARRWNELAAANPQIKDPNKIRPGDQIRIPTEQTAEQPTEQPAKPLSEEQVHARTGQADDSEVSHNFVQHGGVVEKPRTGSLNLLTSLNQHDAGASGHHSTAHTVKDGATRATYAAESLEAAAHQAHRHNASGKLGKASAGLATVAAGAAVYDAGSNIKKAVESGEAGDIKQAVSSSVTAGGAVAKAAFLSQAKNTALARGAGVVAGAVSLKYAAEDGIQAGKDIAQAVRTGASEDVNTAIGSSGRAVSNAGWSAKMVVIPTAQKVLQKRAVQQAAVAAAQHAGGAVVAKAAGKAAAKAAVANAGKHAAVQAAITAGAKTGAKRAVYRAAGQAAGKAAAKAAATGAAKGLGRFVPGVNIAIAVADTAQAVAIQRDPNASTGKKVAAWATAGLSAVAATNVPVVSQVAAGVSLVTGFLRDLW